MHICQTCGESDPTQFYASNATTCKTCHKARAKAWQRAHPERTKEHRTRYDQRVASGAYVPMVGVGPGRPSGVDDRVEPKSPGWQIVQDYKREHRNCTDCGNQFPPFLLEFDHLPGFEKVFNLSDTAGRSVDEVIDEIEKCELVCPNCHRIRTRMRQLEAREEHHVAALAVIRQEIAEIQGLA